MFSCCIYSSSDVAKENFIKVNTTVCCLSITILNTQLMELWRYRCSKRNNSTVRKYLSRENEVEEGSINDHGVISEQKWSSNILMIFLESEGPQATPRPQKGQHSALASSRRTGPHISPAPHQRTGPHVGGWGHPKCNGRPLDYQK